MAQKDRLASNPLAGFDDLVNSGSQTVDGATLQALFGLGPNQIEIRLTDRFLRDQSMFVNTFINFNVVPEPGTAILLLVGLVGLQQASRHRTV
ncbi:MAG: PEP-CTERM sorting domain-containing protein [Proteobacteria bacterium]|nr:PEP-CTERM sorting domain-containing protein [Pseudomonadota bacterium]